MRKSHCSRFFASTSAPQRSQCPSTTCSFASTVWSFGHHLTGTSLRYDEAVLEEAEEEPLRPAVVLRLVRREDAVPVDRPAEPLHRRADRRDVARRHVARIAARLDRRVLGREAERVEAHRPQDLLAVAPPEVRDDLAEHVVAHVPHVQLAGRVREHLEHVCLAAAVEPLRAR